MKIAFGVTLCGGFFLLMNVAGCSDYVNYSEPTSQFGTGTYKCFYQNTQTGRLYQANEEDKKKSRTVARQACFNGLHSLKDKGQCQAMECIFR